MKAKSKKNKGFTLMEILIALAILAGVAALVVGPKIQEIFSQSDEAQAKILQDQIQRKYEEWTECFGRHDSAASVTLTDNLFRIITGPEVSGGTPRSSGSGWVNEQVRLMPTTGGASKSLAGAIRLKTMGRTATTSGTSLLYDSKYLITFVPSSNSAGTWTVTIASTAQ